jgi:lipid A 3-O-deacylase
MNHTLACIALTLISSSLLADMVVTETPDSHFDTVGLRVAVETSTLVSLTSYELYGTSVPQWSWDLSEKFYAGLGYEAAVGALAGEGDVAGYLHFGLNLELAYEDLPVALVLQSGPSLYSEDSFGDFDIGGNIQFTSSIGLNWQLYEAWAVEYRYQHTSNAGIKDENPGVEMHAFALSHTF